METKVTKVRLLLAVVTLVPLCAASLCPQGVQYWSNDAEECLNCSRCDAGAKQVVIRPCQAHADTVCGPVSDLNVDWSWLKHKHVNKHHDKHPAEDGGDLLLDGEKKHHNKKNHNHHSLDDDIEDTPLHQGALDDEVETVPAVTHHGNHKGHKNSRIMIDEGGLETEKKSGRNHHIPSDSYLSEDFDVLGDHKKPYKLPPPPPLKSTDDLEKEWRVWLKRSKNMLQHRKDDLLKNLHKESPYNENHHNGHKLNHPSTNSFDDFDGEIFHHGAHHKDYPQKHFSPLDLELFDRLLTHHEHQKHEERLSLSHLLSAENRHSDLLDMMKSEDENKHDRLSAGANDLAYPMDSFDFRSVIPTHRLFLGEPSTISEIMDQDFSEESEDDEDERLKEDKEGWQSDPSVVAVPFTTAERIVWDWQAVALASAVAACLLFFAVVGAYTILQARQWRRLKNNFDTDVEELSVKMGLMQSVGGVGASAAEAANTNHYLEDLLENKKKSSNIYTQKRPSS